MATIEITTLDEPRIGNGSGIGGPASIIVLNDNHNTFEGVATALSQVLPGVSFAKGMSFANQIHNQGQARVWSGQREPAELYWEQLHQAGLTLAPLD